MLIPAEERVPDLARRAEARRAFFVKVGRAFLFGSCGGLLVHGMIKKHWFRTDLGKEEAGQSTDAPYEGGCPLVDLSDGERTWLVGLPCNNCDLRFACRWSEQYSGKTGELKEPDFLRPLR